MTATRIKCVVVGDGGAGKSYMIHAYRSNEYGTFNYPSVLDNFSEQLSVDGTEVELSVWDTYGQYSRLRPLVYPDTDIFLIIFSVDNGDSLENVKETWCPEVCHFCPGTPIILVGTKSDLRDNSPKPNKQSAKGQPSYRDGLTCMKDIRAVRYLECSSLSQQGVKEVFEAAVRTVLDEKTAKEDLQASRRSRRSCSMV